jgi:CheY-like chemotaxis protein
MAKQIVRVLVIDDNPEMTALAKRELLDAFADDSDTGLTVSIENDFELGFNRVRSGECDIVVLDVRREKTGSVPEEIDAGRHVFESIESVRFLPVIFWTALPQEVDDKRMPPLVDVFKKDDLPLLPDAIRRAISSGVVSEMRSIENHVAQVMREQLWTELAPNWDEYMSGAGPQELARLLISRVSHSLQNQALPEITSRPSHRYIYAPVSSTYRPGDLLSREAAGVREWWIILTPACDLAHEGKVDFVLLGRATYLKEHRKYESWAAGPSKNTWAHLQSILVGQVARYAFFPAFREVPDLIVDLSHTVSVPISELNEFSRVASLVAPYGEALLAQHSHFRGRIGTPDLDPTAVQARLLEELPATIPR